MTVEVLASLPRQFRSPVAQSLCRGVRGREVARRGENETDKRTLIILVDLKCLGDG